MMKKIKAGMKAKTISIIIVALIMALSISMIAVACNELADKEVTVRFMVDGDEYESVSGVPGAQLEYPGDPQKDGYNFDGWYADQSLTGDPVDVPEVFPDDDAKFYAKFTLKPATVSYTINVYLQKFDENTYALLDEFELYDTVTGEDEVGANFAAGYSFAYGPRVQHEDQRLSGVLSADPNENVFKIYFERYMYTIKYNKNADDASGEMPTLSFPYGATVNAREVAQSAFTRDGYRFAQWAGSPSGGGVTLPTVNFIMDKNYDLYAIWDMELTLEGDGNELLSTNKMWYSTLTTAGLGRVYFFTGDNGDELKQGFVADSQTSGDDNVKNFTYYVDLPEGGSGDVNGEIDLNNGTFRFAGEEYGTYFEYLYQFGELNIGDGSSDAIMYAIHLDGFGKMIYGYIDINGGFQATNYGKYEYDDTYSDYKFTILNIETQQEIGKGFNFRLFPDSHIIRTSEGEEVVSTYICQGQESNTFYDYDLLDSAQPYMLQLDGYGNSRLYEIIDDTTTSLVAEGTYKGTDLYEDPTGEWQFESDTENFKFILTYMVDADSTTEDGGVAVTYIYLVYNERYDVTLDSSDPDSTAKLMLNGYNSMAYLPNGGGEEDWLYGAFLFNENEHNITMTVYKEVGDKVQVADELMFTVDFDAKTFALNNTGFLYGDDNVITGYVGKSKNIEIPDGVVEIGEAAFASTETDVSLVSVIIPASVRTIGARAFENENTLETVTFLSTEPIEIDWSQTNDPFRWTIGNNFKIVVPNSALQAYRDMWTDCKYTITSLEELSNKPQWVIENGILTEYNQPADQPIPEEGLDLVIPDEVVEIASGVFQAMNIKSVDLKNVTKIGASAFAGCTSLVSVKAPALRTLESGSVTVPGVFDGCEALEDISLPVIETIGSYTFYDCYSLKKIFIGKTVTKIFGYAFGYCYTDCDLYHPFIIEFEDGTEPPEIESNAVTRIESYRFSVDTVESAMEFILSPTWLTAKYDRMYVRELVGGPLDGTWIDPTNLSMVTFDGRAELLGYVVAYYELAENGDITFTQFDRDVNLNTYNIVTFYGHFDKASNVISFEYDGEQFKCIKADGEIQFTSADDKTLTIDLDTYSYDPDSLMSSADGTFDGQPIQIIAVGNQITGLGYVSPADGLQCILSFTTTSEMTFTYTSSWNDMKGPFHNADGSYVNVMFNGGMVYVTGSIVQFTNTKGEPIVVTSLGTWTVVDYDISAGRYQFVHLWLNTRVYVDLLVNEDDMSFTYSYVEAERRETLKGDDATVVLLVDKTGAIKSIELLLPEVAGGSPVHVDADIQLQPDGSYTAVVDFEVEVYDSSSQEVTYEPSPLNGTYKIVIDRAAGTCVVTKIA